MKAPLLPRSFPALLLSLALAGPACAAGGPDELWEITSSMSDKASGFAMPANTMRQCLRKGASEKTEEAVPLEKDCKMLDQKVSGSKVSFRFECSGRNRMSGNGEIDRPNAANYSGRMQMKGMAEGRPMDMAMTYSGKRVGNCTFGEPQPMPGMGGMGGGGRKGQMPQGMQGMTPEQMQQLQGNPEAMRKMFGGGY